MDKPLTKEDVLTILDRYRIGKKPLAGLLGWGVTTVMQYCVSDHIPDNEYAKKLRRILDDPGYYREILVEGKSKITEVAYNRSLAALDKMYTGSEILECAAWACECMEEKLAATGRPDCGEVMESGLLRLESVLLWSQIFAIRLLGKPLFEDECQPGKTGLPYKAVEEKFPGTVTLSLVSGDSLPAETKELIARVNDVLMWYGPSALLSLMKAEIYRLCGAPGARRRRIVKVDTLRKAYSEVFDKAGVRKLKDIDSYIQKRIAFIKKNPPQ